MAQIDTQRGPAALHAKPATGIRSAPRLPLIAKSAKPAPAIQRGNALPAARKFGTRARLVTAAAVLLTLGVAGYTFHATRSQDGSATQATSAAIPLARCIAAPGLVESESGLRNLSFEIPGILKSVCVQEGQNVKAGELIAELQNADVLARVDSAGADVAVAEAQLRISSENFAAEIKRAHCEVDRLKAELALIEAGPRKEELARAQAEQRVADAEARRVAEDAARLADPAGVKSGAWTEADQSRLKWTAAAAKNRLDAAQANQSLLESGSRQEEKDRARATLAIAEAQLKQLEATQPFKLAAAQAQVKQAKAKLNLTEADLAKTRLHAPIGGVVIWKFLHAGEAVDPMHPTPVVAVADVSRLRVRADVDEADYPQIVRGLPARISADAFSGKFFSGKVQRIADSAGQKRFSTGEAKERMDVKVIETVISLEENCPFKLGLRVTVYFDLGTPPVSPKKSGEATHAQLR
jgi:HlyD family secretion protein